MKTHFYRLFFIVLFWPIAVIAQEQNEAPYINNQEAALNRTDWVPTLLNASGNVLLNMVVFNGNAFGWTLRGNSHTMMSVDGIIWDTPLKKLRPDELYTGLQNELYSVGMRMNGILSEQPYSTYANVFYKTAQVQDSKPSISVNTSFGNTMHSNLLRVHYNSGLQSSGWIRSLGMVVQQAPPGYAPLGYKQSTGIAFSTDKKYSNKILLGFSLIWNYNNQSKAATTVGEMYSLAGSKIYSPNWGWYNQQLYYPNTKQTNTPVFSVRFQKEWSAATTFKMTNAMTLGNQSETSLDWTKTNDPRPDYYKYLPSYVVDTNLRNALFEWYLQHPEQMQIQFDKLAKINQASNDKQSFYIINQQNASLFLLRGAAVWEHIISPTMYLKIGTNYALDQIHNTNSIKDLLGGKFYYNYNGWMNDDGQVASFQNDIQHPDRKIKQGEQWGADYAMRAIQMHAWTQFNKEGPKIETAIALGYGLQGMQRIGYNQNGLFPMSSKGISELLLSPSFDIQYQWLYKFSGRLYLRSSFFAQWLPMSESNAYINSELNSMASPFSLMETYKGLDFSWMYRAPSLKLEFSAYWNKKENQSVQKMFYQDAFSKFVNGMVGNIISEAGGVEATLETNLLSNIQIAFVSNLQQFVFANNPEYKLVNVNDLQPMASGILYLKNLPASRSPGLVNALSLNYQPVNSFRLGLNLLYAQMRPVLMDYFRRSNVVKNSLDALSWNQIQAPNFLPNAFIGNAFLSKSLQHKSANKIYKWTASINVRNLFNNNLPVFAYEQTRFDYLHFNANKYAVKYLMDQGITYSIRLQLQVQ